MNQHEEDEEKPNPVPEEGRAALDALRNLWGATGKERDFHEKISEEGSGRSAMESIIGSVGYEDLEHFAEGEATHDVHAAGQRLSAAFHRTLEREGKIVHSGQSMSDLIRSKQLGGVKGGNQEPPPWEKE